MAHVGHPAQGSYAPPGSFHSGEALLRQLQQGVGTNGAHTPRAPVPPGMQGGPALHDPSILAVHPSVPGMHPQQPQAPGIGSYMPGLTSGFRPGSRGPPPGFAGYLPQQPTQQAPPLHSAPPQLNGGAAGGGQAAHNGFAPGHPPHMNGGNAPDAAAAPAPANEASPGAKGRRRKGKAAPPVVPAAAPQFPGSATLHDPDTLAGRLQQAKERFYSLNS